MISYTLEYIAGANRSIYNLWETIDDDNGIERNIVAVVYDPSLAIDIMNYLNEEQE